MVVQRAMLIAALIFLTLGAVVGAEDDSAWFGMEIAADGEGRFWNPVISRLEVKGVVKGSPADEGGLRAGDTVLTIDGVRVEGERMKKLAPLFEKSVGDSVDLTVQRASGETHQISLVGITKPE